MPLLRDSLLMQRIAPAAVLGSSDWSWVAMTMELGGLGDGESDMTIQELKFQQP